MTKPKDVIRTAAGVFAASVAKDAFAADSRTETIGEKIALKAVGSVAASVSFHLLKQDVVDVVQQISNKPKLLKE